MENYDNEYDEEYEARGDFGIVPNEVMDNLFEFLPPNDLAEMSLTSKPIKALSEIHFSYKRRCGRLRIRLNKDGKIQRIQPSEDYEKRFTSVIGDLYVLIETSDPNALQKLFRCIGKYCKDELRCLQLIYRPLEEEITVDMVNRISRQMHSLETLLLYVPSNVDLFLRHCPNLENLFIRTASDSPESNNWIHRNQPNLKVFTYADFDYRKEIDLTGFILNAPQLQAIGLNNWSAINNFLASDRNIPYAAFGFHKVDNLPIIWEDIQECCNNNRFGSLHIYYEHWLPVFNIDRPFYKFENLPCIKSLHSVSLRGRLKNTDVQPNIESLCIDIWDCNLIGDQIAEFFPNLKELYISIIYSTVEEGKCILMVLTSEHDKLERLNILFSKRIKISEKELIEMNDARSKLKDPAFLTIQISAEVTATKFEHFSIVKPTEDNDQKCLTCKMLSKDYRKVNADDLSAFLKTLRIPILEF